MSFVINRSVQASHLYISCLQAGVTHTHARHHERIGYNYHRNQNNRHYTYITPMYEESCF